MKSMRFVITVFTGLILIQPIANGQSKLSLSISLAPEYAHNRFSTVVPVFGPPSPGFTNLESKSYVLSYTFGLMARYSFSEKWSATSGIWASHPFTGKESHVVGNQTFSTPLRFNDPFEIRLRIPLTVNFRPSTNRISPYISAGTTFDFRPKVYLDVNGDGIEERVRFGKSVTLTPIVGIGGIVDLKKNLSLVVQPTFQYLIQSQEGYNYRRAYIVGLQGQLLYRF